MTPLWLLDTSALLVLRDDEGGAERVAGLLQAAQSGESRCLVCFMSRMELLYRVWKDEGEAKARLADAQLQSLPIAWVACSDGLLEQAAAIKAPGIQEPNGPEVSDVYRYRRHHHRPPTRTCSSWVS